MARYQGIIRNYWQRFDSPRPGLAYPRIISIEGDFGIANFFFVPDGGQLGQNRRRVNSLQQVFFDIHFWLSSWAPFVDMLRNEKPIYFYYDDSTNTSVVATTSEPVGEAELSREGASQLVAEAPH